MVIRLNVLITVSGTARTFSVWSDKRSELPWIDIYEGHGTSLSSAIDDFYENLPNEIIVDDEVSLTPSDVSYVIKRPFKITYGREPRIFRLS